MKQDMIVILDLGSTENTVVARRIRDLGVYSEIHPHDITAEQLDQMQNVKGIILNGGKNRVVDVCRWKWILLSMNGAALFFPLIILHPDVKNKIGRAHV